MKDNYDTLSLSLLNIRGDVYAKCTNYRSECKNILRELYI